MKDGSKENIRVSVVIPSYQPGDDIMHCLASVYDQTFDLPYEVIVVDSSPKNPAGYVHDKYPDVRMFHLEKRTLSGRARSMGALKARGDVVFFTDTDCVVDPNWMNRLWKSFQKGYFVSGGSIVNGTPGSRVGTSEYLLEFNEMNPHANAGHVKALPSCNLAVKKEVFGDVGYFPDFMKGEDTIFCENVIASGRSIYFDPEARIRHSNRTRFIQYIKNQVALGEGAVEARRRIQRHGSFLVRWPIFVACIPVYRTFAIGWRLLNAHPALFLSYVFHYPFILLGLMAHTWGFIRGPYREGLSTEKREPVT